MPLLALSSVALVLPTPFANYYDIQDERRILIVSRTAAIFLMSMYIQLLIFQLNTHSDLSQDEDDDKAHISMKVSIVGLLVTTALITPFSDALVGSIDGFVSSSGISCTFVGLIILHIVGNVVEHIAAITVACKDKMDLAMGVVVGSSVQISSLFVVPFNVLMGWALERHNDAQLFTLRDHPLCLQRGDCQYLSVQSKGKVVGRITSHHYNIMVVVGFFYEDVQDFLKRRISKEVEEEEELRWERTQGSRRSCGDQKKRAMRGS